MNASRSNIPVTVTSREDALALVEGQGIYEWVRVPAGLDAGFITWCRSGSRAGWVFHARPM
jgi:hypothetical protein